MALVIGSVMRDSSICVVGHHVVTVGILRYGKRYVGCHTGTWSVLYSIQLKLAIDGAPGVGGRTTETRLGREKGPRDGCGFGLD